MRTHKIFLAHPSDYPKEDIDAIYAACTRASDNSVLFKPDEWPNGLCDNSKNQNTIIKKNIKSSDIFFRLLYIDYKEGTQTEYEYAKRKKKTIFTFIRVDSSEESKQLVNALTKSEGDNTGTICEYPTKEFPDLGLSVEIQLRRYLQIQKKRWWIRVVGILTGIMIFLLWLILTGKVPWLSHNTKEPEGPKTEIGLPPNDNEKAAFVARIDNAESLAQQGKKSAALDTLNILSVICKPEWGAEKTRIDNLRSALRAPKQPAYVKNACVVVSSNPDIVSHVRGKILTSSCGLTFPAKGNPEWRISITEESIDTVKEFEGKTNYKSTVTLTASIMQNGKYKSEKKAEESARSYENQEKALHNARKLAMDKLSAQIIEVIGQ